MTSQHCDNIECKSWNIIHLVPCRMPWFSSIHISLILLELKIQCKVNLDRLWLLDQSHNCISRIKGPQSLFVKWVYGLHGGLSKYPRRALHTSERRAGASPKKARALAPQPWHALTMAYLDPSPPRPGLTLHSWRLLVHITHIECTSFSRSKIQYICSLPLSK